MQDKILDILRRSHQYVSGEDISAHLNISRQALWKHIQNLKDSGYDIVAVPHLGYRLIASPDRLFPSEVAYRLHTKNIGKKMYYFDTLGSTMDVAEELGQKQAPEGTLVISEAQTKGKGRLNREWSSPKYKGIYFSLILRPKILPNSAPVLTLLCAVSVCEAVKKVCGVEIKIKWPNDLFIRHKKVGGILTELNAEMDAVRFVVMGIGINVNNDTTTLVEGATSLREQNNKVPLNRVELLQEIVRSIEARYLLFQKEGAVSTLTQWRQHALTLGRRIKVLYHKEHLEGEAVDVDGDGALLLRTDAGLVRRVTAGDVVHCR